MIWTIAIVLQKVCFMEARHLISHWQQNGKVTAVSIPNAQWDIDTPEDWDQLATRAEGR